MDSSSQIREGRIVVEPPSISGTAAESKGAACALACYTNSNSSEHGLQNTACDKIGECTIKQAFMQQLLLHTYIDISCMIDILTHALVAECCDAYTGFSENVVSLETEHVEICRRKALYM